MPIINRATAKIDSAHVTKLRPINASMGIKKPMKPNSRLEFVLVNLPDDMSLSDMIANMVFKRALTT
jgi:hypothetical protein